MKRLVAALGATALVLWTAAPSCADEPLAGTSLFAVSHGQPFCTSKAELQAFLDAQITQAPIGLFSFPTCRYVEDNALVAVGQDFRGGRYMHMVRARANLFPFGTVDGYTFSAGLYSLPVRSTPAHLNPFF